MTGFRSCKGTGAIVLAGALGTLLAFGYGADAAPRAVQGTQLAAAESTKAAEAGAESGGAAKAAADEDSGCHRARKRLWVEGEGWIVRRVTTCR